MDWLQSIIYGFALSLSEFMPVSSLAHQKILCELFGVDRPDVVQNLLVHAAALAALLFGCNNMLDQIKRSVRVSRRGSRHADSILDYRLVRTAAIPMLVIYLILTYVFGRNYSFPLMALFLLINGVIIFISGRMLQGNKDARSMSKLDSYLIGAVSAISALPGISRVGAGTSVAISRRADRLHALNWAFLLSIPALALICGLDVIGLFSAANLSVVSGNLLCYFFSAFSSFIGGYTGVMLMRLLAVKVGYTGFAYYSWGAALFTFVLYLL